MPGGGARPRREELKIFTERLSKIALLRSVDEGLGRSVGGWLAPLSQERNDPCQADRPVSRLSDTGFRGLRGRPTADAAVNR